MPGQRNVLPWVWPVDGHPNIIAALPGRATLAIDAAATLFESVNECLSRVGGSTSADLPDVGADWSNAIHMHYDDHYAGLNDVESGATP